MMVMKKNIRKRCKSFALKGSIEVKKWN